MFLSSPRKKFFILGNPGVGKTTLIEFLYNFLKKNLTEYQFLGFLTKELREKKQRKGFIIKLLNSSQEYILAEKRKILSKHRFRVGKYEVLIENLEKALEELEKLKKKINNFFIIDEIGKMEILSQKFCKFIDKILNSNNYLLATVGKGEHPFLKKVRNFKPSFICEVTFENRNFLKKRLELEFIRAGKLIVIEGIDGAGKTTFSKALYNFLKEKNIDCILSSEPTNGPWGAELKELLKKKKNFSQQLKDLFIKDRKWHVENLIIPSLQKGSWVILDRYYLSTIAYQGAQGFSIEDLFLENETIAPIPDLVVYLDISLETAFERINPRQKLSIFENENFLKKVAEIYKSYLPWFNYIILDGTLPIEKNLEILDSKLKNTFSQYIMKM